MATNETVQTAQTTLSPNTALDYFGMGASGASGGLRGC